MADNPFTTYGSNATNIMYEDLIDIVTNIDPIDTYVLSNSGKTRAKQRLHEWTTDVLLDVASAGVAEGADFSGTAITGATRLGNRTQISRQGWTLSDTMMATDNVGGNQEAYQMQRHLKSLSRDIEYALLINGASASASAGSARVSQGIDTWIASNVGGGSASVSPGLSAITEDIINGTLQTIWAAGGRPAVALMGGFQKRSISNLGTESRERGLASSVAAIQMAVDIYKSDFGPIMLKTHHLMQASLTGSVIILGDMDLWKVAWLRPIKAEEISRVGSARRFMIEAEYTLESRQEKGSGKVKWLTPS